MNSGQPLEVDVAVVGGGISGLYAAWRLHRDARPGTPSIALLEASDRIGGRLWSIGMHREWSIPAELGGMFFSNSQSLVYDLTTRVLNLDTQSVNPIPDFAYLRTKRFEISDFAKQGTAPYWLAPEEAGKSYHEILFLALHRIIPDLSNHWPLNSQGTPEKLIQHLRTVQFEGRYLHQWGFWNLLAKVISNEAYLCLRDLVGSFAFFSNWNGYDASFSLLHDLNGAWYKLPRGYQRLPDALATDLQEDDVPILMNSQVTRIRDAKGSHALALTVRRDGGEHEVRAQSVILALPKRAIELIDSTQVNFTQEDLVESLAAVEGVPACKIFLTFDDPWWRNVPDGPGRIKEGTYAVSHTDLPMRQCYYLGVDPDTGQGLMLASYSDAQSVPFWSSLMTDSGRPGDLLSDVPQAALEEIGRQLSEMHGVEVPPPTEATFVNWSRDPYGGGWHAWLPGWQSVDVMAHLRKPDPDRNFHVCGEAISAYQGWVEGALTSAEVMLREEFGLAKPDWLTSEGTLAPYYR